MEARDLVFRILRRWKALSVLAISAGLVGYALTFLMVETYEATALVLVRPEEKLSISTSNDTASAGQSNEELLSFPITGGATTIETPTNTYIEIIRSQIMAQGIVRKLGVEAFAMEKDTGSRDVKQDAAVQGETEPSLLASLKDWLEPIKDALPDYVIDTKNYFIYGRTFEPESDLDSAIGRYLNNVSLEAVKDTFLFKITYSAANGQQAADVANATARLFLDYISEMNSAEQENALEFIGNQLKEAQRNLAEAMEDLRAYKSKNKTVAFEDETVELIRMAREIETDLERSGAELSGLLETHRATHPKVVALIAEKEYLQETLEGLRRSLEQRPTTEAVLAALQLEVESAEETYQILKREYEETKILLAKTISEMRIISPAVVPSYPAKPIRIIYGMAALVVALLFGVHLVGFFELISTKIRSIEDVERTLDLPVLATIPRSG